MRTHRLVPVLVAAILIAGSSTVAAETPLGTFRAFIDYAIPTADTTSTLFGEQVRVEAESTFGLGLFYELRGDRFGIELGVMFQEYDFKIRGTEGSSMDAKLGKARVTPLVVGLDIHMLRPSAKADLYFAPLLTYNIWEDFKHTGGGTTGLENEWGVGAVLGIDVPFGSAGWQFNGALRYLKMQADDKVDAIDIHPLYIEAGVGYRF